MSPHQMAPMLAYIGSSTQTPRTYGAQAVFQEGGGMCPTSYLVVSAHGATPWWVGGMPTKHVCSIWPHLVCGTWCACNGRDAVCFTYLGVLPSTPPFGYAVFCILVPRMWGSCHIPKCVVLSLSRTGGQSWYNANNLLCSNAAPQPNSRLATHTKLSNSQAGPWSGGKVVVCKLSQTFMVYFTIGLELGLIDATKRFRTKLN